MVSVIRSVVHHFTSASICNLMDEIRSETTLNKKEVRIRANIWWIILCDYSHPCNDAQWYRHFSKSFLVVFDFLIVVLGELCLSPVGLSATTKLAPTAFSAQTMSLWFLSNASAQGINAQIVKLFNPDTEVAYFGIIGGIV